MSIVLNTRPQKTVTDGTYTWLSKWWALHHPIVFGFQRRDWEVLTVVPTGFAYAIVTVDPSVIITGDIADYINQQLYVNSGSYNGNYRIANAIWNGTNYQFTIDANLGSSTGGYANDLFMRKGYYLAVNIYAFNFTTLVSDLVDTVRSAGDSSWNINVDIHRPLQSKVRAVNGNPYSSPAYLDKDTFVVYYITYQEVWHGSSETVFSDQMEDPNSPIDPPPMIPRRFFATNSTRQIQQLHGSNLASYVTVANNVNTSYKAKFISDFVTPTYFPGYPWDIAFILSDLLGATLTKRKEQEIDDTETVIGSDSDDIDTGLELDGLQMPGEIRVMLSGSYSSAVNKVLLWIETGDPFESRYVEDGYVDDGYVEIINGPSFSPFDITERRAITISRDCYDNPVYLAWKGSEGGWNYWLFGGDQKVANDTGANGEFEKNIADLETADTKVGWLNKTSKPSMQIGANGIPVSNFEGIRGLMESVKVQMLVSSSPIKWQTVQVRPGSMSYQTKVNKFDVDMIIDLPYRNTLTQ